MKTLVGNQNEMNYKALYESAMRKIAKLEQELAETKAELEMETIRADAMYDCWQYAEEELEFWQNKCTKNVEEDVKLEAKAELYEVLLCDAVECYEQLGDFDEIIAEFSALQEGKTTGYAYFDDEDKQSLTLTCFGITKEEPKDATQMIRNQIIKLLQEDGAEDVMEALIGVFEAYNPEVGYYVLNDETGLNYLLKRHFSNDLTAFSQWVASIKFESSDAPYFFRLTDGEIVCVPYSTIRMALNYFVQDCPDEALDRMIAILDDLQLW